MLAEEGLEQRARHFPDGSYYSGTWLHDLVSAWERGAASSVHADASTPVPDASSGPPRASFLSVRPAHPSPASGSAGGPGQRYGRAGGLTAGATATSALFSTCVQPHGQGEYRWVEGSFYDGTWSNGLRHGVGKYVWPSGTVYQVGGSPETQQTAPLSPCQFCYRCATAPNQHREAHMHRAVLLRLPAQKALLHLLDMALCATYRHMAG